MKSLAMVLAPVLTVLVVRGGPLRAAPGIPGVFPGSRRSYFAPSFFAM